MTCAATAPAARLAPLMSSLRQDWRTPRDLFLSLHAHYKFTLDAAASADNAQLEHYFSEADDALDRPWAPERVWLNPPYGKDIGQWMAKAASAQTLVVVLVPARTDTAWWHDQVMPKAVEVAFIRGRLTFEGADGPAPFPSVLVTYRPGDHKRCCISVDKLGAAI